MRSSTWILVADASRARLFSTSGKQQPWSLVREFSHPESAAKVSEIMSDRAGRVQQRVGDRRSGMEQSTSPKETEAKRFAGELAERLDQGHARNAFSRLVLVAPPQFLGLLRGALSAPLAKLVISSVDKDLTQMNERDLPERLRETL